MENIELLISKALEMRKLSYCPYSGYAVGAALLMESGQIYTGCNIENAAYGPSICAERTAIFKAVSEGEKDFTMIAVTGGFKDTDPVDYAFPCGVCRQVMAEFCNPDKFVVCVANSVTDYKLYKLSDLLPDSFGPGNLKE